MPEGLVGAPLRRTDVKPAPDPAAGAGESPAGWLRSVDATPSPLPQRRSRGSASCTMRTGRRTACAIVSSVEPLPARITSPPTSATASSALASAR
jgi:hypothetical protein